MTGAAVTDPEARLSAATGLQALLGGTADADLIPALLDATRNADGFPYTAFSALVQRRFEQTDPAEWPAVRDVLRQAVADRRRNGGFDPLLLRPLAAQLLGGVPWGVLHAGARSLYGPQAQLAMVSAQLASTVLPQLARGSWQAALSALNLLPLDSLLSSVRNIEQVDQLVRSLPQGVQDALHALHTSVIGVEDALLPRSPVSLGLAALAMALWTLYEHATPASDPVCGDANRGLLQLPAQMRGALQWNRRLGALSAPPDAQDTHASLQQDIQAIGRVQQALQHALRQGGDDGQVIGHALAQLEVPQSAADEKALQALRSVVGRYLGPGSSSPALCSQLADWLGEHLALLQQAMPALPIRSDDPPPRPTLPLTPGRAGTSPHVGMRPADQPSRITAAGIATVAHASASPAPGQHAGNGWHWPGLLIPAMLRGVFNDAVPPVVPDLEAGRGLLQAPLANAAAPGILARRPGLYRSLALGGAASLVAAAALVRRAWTSDATQAAPAPSDGDDSLPPQPATLDEVMSLLLPMVELGDGHWGSPLDLQAPRALPRMARSVDAQSTAGPPPAPPSDIQQQAMQLRGLAVDAAETVAEQQDLEWLRGAAESEKALYGVWLWQARNAFEQLQTRQAQGRSLLADALGSAGWDGEWQDITVNVHASGARAGAAADTMSLDDLCLVRQPQPGDGYMFQRGGRPLAAQQQRTLQAFLQGTGCRRVAGQLTSAQSAQRPHLATLAEAKFKLAALESKIRGVIGHGHGAGIVLDFQNGAATVQRAAMTLSVPLAAGGRVNATLPTFVILRRNDPGAADHGEIVVHHTEPETFHVFNGTGSSRGYFDMRRAKLDLLTSEDLPWRLADEVRDVIEVKHVAAVGEVLEQRQLRPIDWDLAKDLDWNFVTNAENGLHAWADALAGYGLARLDRQHMRDDLRLSPQGLRLTRANAAWERAESTLLSFHDHAKTPVTSRFATVFSHVDPSSEAVDPDLVELELNGRIATLTDWAIRWWEPQGLKRGFLSPGLWPPASELKRMSLIVRRRDEDGTSSVDAQLTERLSWESNRRYFCKALDDLVESSQLGDNYRAYLEAIEGTHQQANLAAKQADFMRARVVLMIEQARRDGTLDTSTAQQLARAAEHQSRVGSPFERVEVASHVIPGLVALRAGGSTFVFVADGPDGDRVMEAGSFRQWLIHSPKAEAYIRTHARYRHHKHLQEVFAARRSSQGIELSFDKTEGLDALCNQLIALRLDDVDEITTSERERVVDWLEVPGTMVVGGACTLASGGLAMPVCITGTVGLFARGIDEAIDASERGDSGAFAQALAGAVFDGLDLAEVSRAGALLFRVGLQVYSAFDKADAALRLLRIQRPAFDAGGRLNPAFASSTVDLQAPPLLTGGSDAIWPVYQQDGKEFLKLPAGGFVETSVDDQGIRRLVDPLHRDVRGIPIGRVDGQLTVLASVPDAQRGAPDRLRELIPELRSLDDAALRELMAVHGVSLPGQLSAVARDEWQRVGRQAWLANAKAAGDVRRLQGTPALAALWANTPVVNGGLRVDILAAPDSGLPVVALGTGAGALLRLGQHELPVLTVQMLVQRAGRDALVSRLELAPGVADVVLHAEVERRLLQTLADQPPKILADWEKVVNLHALVPYPVQALRQYYPGLTVAEASDLLTADPGVLDRIKQGASLDPLMSNMVGNRRQRATRQALLQGPPTTLEAVNTLGILLQDAFPGVRFRTLGEGADSVMHLQGGADLPGTPDLHIRFAASGRMETHAGDGWQRADNWEQAVSRLLNPLQQPALDPRSVRQRVVTKMAQRRLAPLCNPRSLKRSDCDALAGLQRVAPGEGMAIVEGPLRVLAEQGRRSVQKGLEKAAETALADVRAIMARLPAEQKAALPTMTPEELAVLGQAYGLPKLKEGNEEAFRARLEAAIADLLRSILRKTPAEVAATAKRWVRTLPSRLDAEDLRTLKALVDVETIRKDKKTLLANVMTAEVRLEWKGQPIILSGTYTSNEILFEYGTGFEPPLLPEWVVVKATLKPGVGEPTLVPDKQGALTNQYESAQFYSDDQHRIGLQPERYLVGMDAWPLGPVRYDSEQRLEFPGPRMMSPELRQSLRDEKINEASLAEMPDGEYFHTVGFRTCSEARFLQDLWQDLQKIAPDDFSPANYRKNLPGLTGSIRMYTETAPCIEVCDRRITSLMKEMSGVDITVGSSFPTVAAARDYRGGGAMPRDVVFFRPLAAAQGAPT